MRARTLLRLDTAVLCLFGQASDEEATVPEIQIAFGTKDIVADNVSVRRAVGRLQTEGFVTMTGHTLTHGQYPARKYKLSIRGKQEVALRLERLRALLDGTTVEPTRLA